MLTLITGSPGAGKTSNTLWAFLKNPEYANRPKFATDIPNFDRAAHGVGDFDSIETWEELPDGSIILCDEAQRFLRPRSNRVVPSWLGAFETHRHRGFDFFFITQHPSLLDAHVRRLIGKHHHYHRPWAIKNPVRYTWEFCEESPNANSFKNAMRQRVKTNPEVFKLYKSTALDTHKRDLPWQKIFIFVGALLVVIGCIFSVMSKFSHKTEKAKQAQTEQQTVKQNQQGVANPFGSPQLDASSMAAPVFKPSDLLPRDKLLPWSAPYYDGLTKPSDFPRIAACIQSSKGCSCYTQQATPLDIEPQVCAGIVKSGTFDNWKSQRDQQQLQTQQAQTKSSAGVIVPRDEEQQPSGHESEAVSTGQQGQSHINLTSLSYTQSPHYTTDTFNQSGYSGR